VTGDGPHPSPELATVAATLRRTSSSPAIPPHALAWGRAGAANHPRLAVSSGQPRTTTPQVRLPIRWQTNRPDLASNDAATPESERRRRPQPDGRQPGSAARYRAGSARHRKPLVRRRAPAVTTGAQEPQSHGLPLRPRTAKQHEAGFESHLTAAAGQRPLPTRQASPRTSLTLPPRWPSPPGPSHIHPHRPCPGRALRIGRQRSFTDNKGRCVFPPSCRIAPYGAVRGSFPSSR
jgi:hypothetical protein